MKKKQGTLILFGLLLAFWIVLSSKLSLVSIIVGFFASLLVIFYNFDLIFFDGETTKLTTRALKNYTILFLILVLEIIKSNIHVMIIVLSPKLKINPGFKRIKQPLKKDFNQVLFANAITLTPGTLTVDMEDEYILVHGLELEHIDDIASGKLQKAFERLEA